MMHKRTILLLLLMLYALPGAAQAQSEKAADNSATDRILVQFNPDVEPHVRDSILRNANSRAVRAISRRGLHVATVPANSFARIQAQLVANPHVAWVEPDVATELTSLTDDPALLGGTQYAPQLIQAPEAWDLSTGANVNIAIVDSGVDFTHPDLAERLLPGYDIFDNDADATDYCGHGTLLAGIAAATANNGLGIAGIAHQAMILPVKITSDECASSYSRIIAGINYAVESGADVIVVASGASIYNTGLHQAVMDAVASGVIVVAASGNRGSDTPFYPGSHPEAFTVSGTNADDSYYTSSTYGTQIDLAAPAAQIYSTYWSAATGSSYTTIGGTSAAAPHVAGAAALVIAQNPLWTLQQVQDALIAGAVDLGAPGWDPYYGAGRVNVLAALEPAPGAAKISMHVSDLSVSMSTGKRVWRAKSIVTAVDETGQPLSGVTVSGLWSAGRIGEVRCITDSTGRCSVESDRLRIQKVREISFTVQSLDHEQYTYAPEANSDLDGDSNGTQITAVLAR